ncbi:MAG: hypothetical protein CMJ78_21535 [Planctomycetaceae bacterium]|nr:hypothetical protein [Planctomycetaceae bacterium]
MKSFATYLSILAVACSVAQAEDAPRAWPFTKLQDVKLPEVQQQPWVRNQIDAFILSKLEHRDVKPAPEASKRSLVRRLYFDLIGLPPTPDEVQTFLNDTDAKSYEKLVDRLLKDPRYGERWARLWLDLARYADTAGYEGDPDLPHAWRYRDYVIDAFNNDKPYDLFIKEQIAGDEFAEVLGAGDLPGVKAEHVVALTFLRLAPFTEPRGDESRHELLSEMTDTVSSVFLGLTVGCAKCHDHKYDDIPTKDFYRMKAFFATVSLARPEPGDGFQIGGPLTASFYRKNEQDWASKKQAALQKELAESKTELAALTKRLQQGVGSFAGFGLQALGGPLGNDYYFDQTKVNDGKLHWNVINGTGQQWQFFTDNQGSGSTGSLAGQNVGKWFGDIPNTAHVSLGQYSEGTGKIVSGGAFHVGKFAEIMIFDHPLGSDERNQLEVYIREKYEAGQPKAMPVKGLSFWLDAADLDADPKTNNPKAGSAVTSWTDRVCGVRISQSDQGLQPTLDRLGKSAAVRFDKAFLVGPINEAAKFVKHQQGAIVVVYSATHKHEGYGFEVGGNGAYLCTFINPTAARNNALDAIVNNPKDDRISIEDKRRYRHLQSRETFIPQHLKRLRPVAMSLRHSYGPPYEPGVPTSRVMIRGEYDNPGEVVTPGFLSCITGHQEPAKIRLDPFKRWPTRSRRMALAQWIASPSNPLTARVMVNRLWHWHFGRGIVATPSDFGQLSGGASHEELLDWLANQFIKNGWSIKKMHRLMVTSNAYRQTSMHENAAAAKVDPENIDLWRFRSRRLEAEAVRDSVLAVSGRLNSEQFGLPIFPPLPNDIADRVKYTNSKWDMQYGPEGRKRSIYIYQQRTLTMPLMQSFDSLVCDQSRPRRRTSVTPLQALAMYNGEFVNEEAAHFATRVRKQAGEDIEKQLQVAFGLAFSRPPIADEMKRLKQFMESATSPKQALIGLCRILFNSNEFIYVD